MTPNNRRRRQFSWGSVIGWLIFILVIAGGPIVNLLRRVAGNTVALPANLVSYLPFAIGALVVLSIAVSAIRALSNANRSSVSLPTDLTRPARPTSAPMPPFGGAPQRPNLPTPRPFNTQYGSAPQPRITTPRFDPVIDPIILTIGILGLLALGGAVLFFFA